ncbi:MAG: orotidine-5'-phosphate decarboxylase [Candidatus Woesebacteria bacterium]
MNGQEKLNDRIRKVNSVLCVGLDSDVKKIPERFLSEAYPQFAFNQWLIEQTHTFVSSYKPNAAFYEARGDQGVKELKITMEYLQDKHPDIFTILDAKRADIGNTNDGYVTSIFDWYGFDAVTLHPYLGQEALQPFLDRKDKVSIILCRTSNPGAPEFQDLRIDGEPLWQVVAKHVSAKWNTNHNCMLVVGATYPKESEVIRKIVGDMTFLIPGIGAQGGDIEKTVKAGMNTATEGMIISSSRAVIFAQNPGAEAKKLRDQINEHRKQ